MTNRSERRADILRRYEILDTTPEESFDAITRLAAAICGAPFSAVTFLDINRQWFKSKVGLGVKQTALSESFCKHVVEQEDLLVVFDATVDPRFMRNALVTSGPELRFYAGCALRAPDGTGIGAICVLDTKARPGGLNAIERSTLEVLARQVEAQLELRMAMKAREAQVAQMRDLTDSLAFCSSHDPLTSLANRSRFAEDLKAGIAACASDGSSVALMILDVDHFKQINDSLGHDAGDALLCGLATSLKSVTRQADSVARLGGDEFAIILRGVGPDGPESALIETLRHRIGQPIPHRGRMLDCRMSIGIATYPKDARTSEALIKCSDLALAAAKLERGSAQIFEARLLDNFDTQLRSVGKVAAAASAGAFEPFYQPKFNLLTGQRVGLEALLRWQGTGTKHLPNIFDPEFPDKALVTRIGLQMIEKILDHAQRWTASGIHVGQVAINSSAVDFASNNFGEQLIAQLRARDLSPKTVEIEVTESVLLGRDVPHIARALRVLRASGIRIALDDFGTGYASLTHLRQYPVDVLKIDKSFVKGITRSVDDAAIVRAVIGLARNLGIVTVAEGVESAAQDAFVRHHGCDIGQGYLYGKAVPFAEISNHVNRRHDVA